jgi:hypothetical protein
MSPTNNWQLPPWKTLVVISLVLVLLLGSAIAATRPEKKHEQQQGSFSMVLAIWILVFAAALSAGYAVGKARSIDFKDPRCEGYVLKYVADKVTESIVWESKHGPNGDLTELSAVWSCRFTCGFHAHLYDSKTRIHHVEAAGPSDVDYSNPPRNGLSLGQVMSALTGAAPVVGALGMVGSPTVALAEASTTNALPHYATLIDNASGGNKLRLIVYGLVGLASGFYIGYKWGYRDQPKLGTESLRKLLDDDLFWQGVANFHKSANRKWTFETRGNTVLARRADEPCFANVRRSGTPAATASVRLPNAPGLISPGVVERALSGGVLGGKLYSSLVQGLVTGYSYEAAAPPDQLIADLRSAGETQFGRRLTEQAGRPLGSWCAGFPF